MCQEMPQFDRGDILLVRKDFEVICPPKSKNDFNTDVCFDKNEMLLVTCVLLDEEEIAVKKMELIENKETKKMEIKKLWKHSVWVKSKHMNKLEVHKFAPDTEEQNLRMPRIHSVNVTYVNPNAHLERTLNETREETFDKLWLTGKEIEEMEVKKCNVYVPKFKPSALVQKYYSDPTNTHVGDSPLEIRHFPQSKRILPKLIKKSKRNNSVETYGTFNVDKDKNFMKSIKDWEKRVRSICRAGKSITGTDLKQKLKCEKNYRHQNPPFETQMKKEIHEICKVIEHNIKHKDLIKDLENKKDHHVHHVELPDIVKDRIHHQAHMGHAHRHIMSGYKFDPSLGASKILEELHDTELEWHHKILALGVQVDIDD